MINKSESIKNLSGALLAFQNEMGKIDKSSTNPFFKSKYAGLPAILSAIKSPLQKFELAFSQFPIGENGLSTIIVHVPSGEYMEATYIMTPAKNDPQGQGSVITYQRRYALCAILGLNVDEDDDGNAASFVKNTKNSYSLPKTKVSKIESCPNCNIAFIKQVSPTGEEFWACPNCGAVPNTK